MPRVHFPSTEDHLRDYYASGAASMGASIECLVRDIAAQLSQAVAQVRDQGDDEEVWAMVGHDQISRTITDHAAGPDLREYRYVIAAPLPRQ